MATMMSKIVQSSEKGIFDYSVVTYGLILLLHNGYNGVYQKIVCIDPSMGITLLLVVQFGQIRMSLKTHTIHFLILYILCIGAAL